MLHLNERGQPTNWEESQLFLETNGYLDRTVFEQELATWHQDVKYNFKNAEMGFTNMIGKHVGGRIQARIPTHNGWTSFSASDDRLRSKLYVGEALDGGKHWENDCAAPDWLTTLYWQEADQKKGVKWNYPIGTFLYSASADKVYIVYEISSFSTQEAADLEDGWDVFDAEGDYSFLRLPISEEEQAQAQSLYEAQQGVIGATEPTRTGSGYAWTEQRPLFFLPGKGSTLGFSHYDHHNVIELPHSSEYGLCFEGERWENEKRVTSEDKTIKEERAIQQAHTFLQERYPTIRIVDWETFQQLEKQRIF